MGGATAGRGCAVFASPVRFEASFKVQRCWCKCLVTLGCLEVRPYFYGLNQRRVLLTSVPVRSPEAALEIWWDYRRRWRKEENFRFPREEGLRVEDFMVLSPEAIRRLVNIVLIAVLFLLQWGPRAEEVLGGKLGMKG